MVGRTHTIGEASRLSGVSVRTLRFYSDRGLLPPTARTESGYRVYSDADLLRLEVIRSLREAGLGLDQIEGVLARRISLAEALALRLQALEANIASQRRVAAAIRAALRSSEPSEEDLRRLWTVTNLSHAERRAVIERFYDQVSEGVAMDENWKRSMVEASTPELPDDPSPEQIDAWLEMSEIVSDPSFVAAMRSNSQVWAEDFDLAAYQRGSADVLAAAQDAMARGLEPTSEMGGVIAREWFEASARAMNRPADDGYKQWLREMYAKHDPRAARYWELVSVLKGEPAPSPVSRAWAWITEAMKHHLA